MPVPSEKKKQEIQALISKIHTKRKDPGQQYTSPEERKKKPRNIP